MARDNRGWHGDPEGHARAGSQSSGNRGNSEQHAEAGRKGGRARGKKNRRESEDMTQL